MEKGNESHQSNRPQAERINPIVRLRSRSGTNVLWLHTSWSLLHLQTRGARYGPHGGATNKEKYVDNPLVYDAFYSGDEGDPYELGVYYSVNGTPAKLEQQ